MAVPSAEQVLGWMTSSMLGSDSSNDIRPSHYSGITSSPLAHDMSGDAGSVPHRQCEPGAARRGVPAAWSLRVQPTRWAPLTRPCSSS